ncbi:hypothetical protein FHS81_002128 [Pseudochelatococcus contaminans]|uniref:Uncharacterized protein n=1 Tax=Pseudochelatococcus contaminans TaxID=1538103 RepID=A0A7W5Z4K4_9HYPH|nr:hypothetical protein [Pseudochelatococcus contaminans]
MLEMARLIRIVKLLGMPARTDTYPRHSIQANLPPVESARRICLWAMMFQAAMPVTTALSGD